MGLGLTSSIENISNPVSSETIVYTDGSCSRGTGGHGIGGYGIVVLSKGVEIGNYYGRVQVYPSSSSTYPLSSAPASQLTPVEGCTNNIAELYAILAALKITSGDIDIYSDSEYSINCLTNWYQTWQNNGWGNCQQVQ